MNAPYPDVLRPQYLWQHYSLTKLTRPTICKFKKFVFLFLNAGFSALCASDEGSDLIWM